MKLQIDTNLKTVTVLEDMNLELLVKGLKVMLGNDYSNYTMKGTGYITYINTPWTYITFQDPYWKWPTITCNTGTHNIELPTTIC
jgi:hypothetical protein